MQKRYFLSFQYLFIDFVTIYLSSIIYNDHKNISVKYELQSTILYRDILKNVILANLLLSCPERLFLNAFIISIIRCQKCPKSRVIEKFEKFEMVEKFKKN